MIHPDHEIQHFWLQQRHKSVTAANEVIISKVLDVLANVTPDRALSTNQLADKLWPYTRQFGEEGTECRKWLLAQIGKLGKGKLYSCVSEGESFRYMGRDAVRKLWHAAPPPTPEEIHEECKHVLGLLITKFGVEAVRETLDSFTPPTDETF